MNYKATFGGVLLNLGNVQYQLGNFDKALEYLNESLIYLINNDHKIGLAKAYGIIALIHEKKTNYVECEKYFSKAIDISSKMDYD
ncbi:tetratricopeptide repeat protein [Clostridium frigoris]|uniref:Tetratricopeptide repeat protein n=1 Tax=Clostridium frigoris TaxID=205327 RepID=A0ABS6BUS6_9CLOT|nr:tetratricopeptide repeat protein [Clostridium frigoris]MBU3160245.1 tetratricopeptide repeat protein [Clostridium frigoris]